MKRNYWLRPALILCLISTLSVSCSVFQPAFKAEAVKPLAAAPEISLKDQNGNLFQLSGLQGKVVLLFFGFTNCVTECPLTLAHIKLALGQLGADAQNVRVVLVSTDPVRDTPMAMHDFLGKFDPSYIGIPGTADELQKVWNKYGIVVLDGGETHSSYTYVVDRSGNLRLRLARDADPAAMASDIKLLLAE